MKNSEYFNALDIFSNNLSPAKLKKQKTTILFKQKIIDEQKKILIQTLN
jgi:hypothetical protein